MKPPRKEIPSRPRQPLPGDIVTDIMGVIRTQFYPESTAKVWLRDSHFIRREFVLYLAAWLDRRGVTLPPEKYKVLLLDRLNEIKTHGNTGGVKYWPGYLKHVLQQHLKHHGEEIYTAAKAIRTLAENTLLSLTNQKPETTPKIDPIRALAEARRDIIQNKRTKRPSTQRPDQLSLL